LHDSPWPRLSPSLSGYAVSSPQGNPAEEERLNARPFGELLLTKRKKKKKREK
jgi:hypothetical protein